MSTTITSDIFYEWVIHKLLPALPPKAVIVLDNASFHKRLDIKNAIEKEGYVLLFQPTYSPDLNKIEKTWAHYKAKRKKYRLSVQELFGTYV